MFKRKYLSLFPCMLLISGMAHAGNINGTANVELENGRIGITYGSDSDQRQAPHAPAEPRAAAPANIPPGHMPQKGECRIWFHDRNPGQQPPPGKCKELRKNVPTGASLIRG